MPRESGYRDELRGQVSQAMIAYAFFRLESAFTIALMIILIFLFPQPFPWWQWWFWLVAGLVAEILIVVTSLSDPVTAQRVMADMFREKFNPRELYSKKYRERLEKALDYQERIEALIRNARKGVLRDHLQTTADGVTDWIANIFNLALRLDAYERDEMIQQDIRSAPLAIKNLTARFQLEDSEAVRQQLRETIRSKEDQWQSLQDLQNMMEKAEFRLEKTLSDLGNIYSQLHQIEARDVDSGRTQRITQDITDEIAELQDIVSTMDEVYSFKG